MIISLFSSAAIFGQAGIGYLFEELPKDSLAKRTITTHTSLKPEIRLPGNQEGSYLSVTGLADLNYLQMVQANYKAGLGVELSSMIKDKWYFRLAAVEGVSTNPSPFRPKSFDGAWVCASLLHFPKFVVGK